MVRGTVACPPANTKWSVSYFDSLRFSADWLLSSVPGRLSDVVIVAVPEAQGQIPIVGMITVAEPDFIVYSMPVTAVTPRTYLRVGEKRPSI